MKLHHSCFCIAALLAGLMTVVGCGSPGGSHEGNVRFKVDSQDNASPLQRLPLNTQTPTVHEDMASS